jgi:uncharacterized protein
MVVGWIALSTLLGIVSRLPLPHNGLRFFLSMVSLVSNVPGAIVVGQLFGYIWLRTVLGYLLSGLITGLFAHLVLRWVERPLRRSPESLPTAHRQVTRRALLLAGGGVMGSAFVVGYSTLVERRNFVLRSHKLFVPNLPPQLTGLRIVLLADLHCGPLNRPGDLLPAIQMANGCKPDLVLMPGDFVHYSNRYFDEAAELIASLQPRIPQGVFVTWGNHDYWNNVSRGIEVLPQSGCQLLTQRRLLVTANKELSDGGSGLWFCGLDDLWEGKPDLAAALHGIPHQQPRIVLSHNPDTAELQPNGRVDLMVSGHTHGGQVYIPGAGTPVVPSRYGQKYASGLVQAPGYPVYVTRGVGVGGVPIRLGVPPEVTFFELHPGRSRLESEPYA